MLGTEFPQFYGGRWLTSIDVATPTKARAFGTATYEVLTDELVGRELPALAPERRDETVGFASRRFQMMASPVRIGLQVAMAVLAIPTALLGPARVSRWLGRTRLPFVSDVPRAMRYLIVSYVWESWPDTAPDGEQPHR